MRFVLLFLCLPLMAHAAEFRVLPDDEPLSQAEVSEITERHLIEFFEGGQARYSAGGSYSYTYESGATAYGRFEVGPDGVVCILFRNGRDRCDMFVRSHGRLVMVTQSGDRFPIRP